MGEHSQGDIRVRVVGVLTKPDSTVLVQRQRGDDFWALPGGGLEFGEGLEACLIREFGEEFGVPIEVEGQILATDNHFEYRGCTRHSIEFYYAVVTSTELDLGAIATIEPDLEATWLTVDQLAELRPAFMRPIIAGLLTN